MNVWTIPGTKATGDEREIKRACARRLKVTRPEENPEAFQELRAAHDAALRMGAGPVDAASGPAPQIWNDFVLQEPGQVTRGHKAFCDGGPLLNLLVAACAFLAPAPFESGIAP
ncbi:hypothetical protein [Massilia sp. TSP1-1-2]|uniref:hypothetical protein n=1 Tax=Massilia sp. TSP1-1-2 TaxID=2804649 RepID=UPI003CF74C0F